MRKKILYTLLAILAIGIVGFLIAHKPLPNGEKGRKAEELADRMLEAIRHEEWEAIPIVAWTFRGHNHYVWDKGHHVVQVRWEDFEVVLNLNKQAGEASQNGRILAGKEKQKAFDYALKNWSNDSFWLNAPAKIRDGGTERFYLRLDNGDEALLVKYHSGGVTPGDAYLWVIGEDHLPKYFRMWVRIIPIGGLKARWTDWGDYEGTKIAETRTLGPFPIPLSDIRTGMSPADFNLPHDYFSRWD